MNAFRLIIFKVYFTNVCLIIETNVYLIKINQDRQIFTNNYYINKQQIEHRQNFKKYFTDPNQQPKTTKQQIATQEFIKSLEQNKQLILAAYKQFKMEDEQKNYRITIQEQNFLTSMISQFDQKLIKIQQNDMNRIACCFTDGKVEIFGKENCENFDLKSDVKDPVTDLLWFEQNQLLCSQDKVIHLFDIEKKQSILEIQGHSQTIYCICKNQYNNLIASAGQDNTIMLWDIRQRKPISLILAHSRSITSLQFSRDSMNIVSCGADGFTRVFSTHTGLCRCTLNSDTTSIPAFVKFADNNQFLLVDTLANKIQLWDWHQQELRQIFTGIQNDTTYLESFMIRDKYTNKQRFLLGYSEKNQIIVWDLLTGNILKNQKIKSETSLKLYQKDGLQSNGFYLYGNDTHEMFKYSIDISVQN